MPPYRYRFIDSDRVDLGPFVSSNDNWQTGAIIPRLGGSFRVTAVVEPVIAEKFQAYLVVERFDAENQR